MRALLNHKIHFLSPDAEWLVFVHGAGGSISTWKRQEHFFAQHFNVLLLDLRDHGNSKNVHPEYKRYRFSVISDDIKRVLDNYLILKAHFITLSFGSILMQDFSNRYPQYIDKVVFTGAVFSGGLALRGFVYMARFLNLFLSFPTMYRLFSFILMPRKENQFARRLYNSQAKKIAQDEYMKWLGLYREFFKLLKTFSNQMLSFPLLIMMGGNDYLFLKSAKNFGNGQSGTQLITVPNTGHIVNIEQPDTFNKTTLDFLKSAPN